MADRRCPIVSMAPGCMVLTVIPFGPSSDASTCGTKEMTCRLVRQGCIISLVPTQNKSSDTSTFANCLTAALLLMYAAAPGRPISLITEPVCQQSPVDLSQHSSPGQHPYWGLPSPLIPSPPSPLHSSPLLSPALLFSFLLSVHLRGLHRAPPTHTPMAHTHTPRAHRPQFSSGIVACALSVVRLCACLS